MNKTVKNLLTALIIILIVGVAFYPRLKEFVAKKEDKSNAVGEKGKNVSGGDTKGATPNANKGSGGPSGKGGPTPIEILVIANQNLEDKIVATGTIIPNEEVEIRPEISGRITAINFKEGSSIAKGQILVRINDADLQAQLLKLGYQKKLAEVNEDRQKKLLEKEAISQREYDISLTNLNSINADIENLKAQIAKTIIRAPFSGQTGLRFVSLGSYISPTSRITTLTSQIPAKLDFSIPAKYASQVGRGTKVGFTIENGERRYIGSVYAVESKIDPNTRTLTLRATSPNTDGKLIPGSFAKVDIILSSKSSSIVVPSEAVIPDLQGHKVFVVKNNKAQPVMVTIGTRMDRGVEILKGLSVGDTLISSGVMQVKPGGEVEIQH